MNSRQMAALLSSLISHLTLLLLLLFPPSSSSSSSSSLSSDTLFTLIIHHFLSSDETAASLSLLPTHPRKRRRTQPESEPATPSTVSRLGRVDSVIFKNPDSFRVIFRMAPSTFEWLSGLLEPLLECRDPVGLPLNLPAELRLGIGLYRLRTGSGYSEIAQQFRVTHRVARFCSKQLCRVLCTNFRFWVGFPNQTEFDSVSDRFEGLTGLPNCCGVIGCTRFNGGTIAAQMVVDSSCRILSIIAGFHGDKSNSRVLKSSTLFKDVQEGRLLNSPPSVYVGGVAIPQYLVGDDGYPLLPWLLVPFDDPKPGSNEEKFNTAHGLMRFAMVKTIASLKNWGILRNPVEEELRTAVAYIGACSILHNALLLREDYSGLCDPVAVEEYMVHDHGLQRRDSFDMEEKSTEGRVIRSALATKAKDLSGMK